MILVAPDHIESGTGRLLSRQTACDQKAISGKYLFGRGDIVYSKIRPYLRKAVLAEFDGLCSADMYPLKPAADVAGSFMLSVLLGDRFTKYAESVSVRSGMPKINRAEMADFFVALPPTPEQRAIATALRDVDALLGGLDQLITKKRDLKQAAMQQLLTCQTRLPGFRGEWEMKRIADVASPSSERNVTGEMLPVLACSKRLGFVDSLGFFKNQVFSKDLSAYRVIRRGEIGYPANHLEEGSIGLQDLYDTALVSPIYVVFRVAEEVSSYFLHRLLKLDSYRQQFKIATTSSVDRRGSLRWPAFSDITVRLPPTKNEQIAISTVLSDMEHEIAALEARRDKTRDLKLGMMQELLTGKTRLM
jgi:type I restriction enzyme S subunit